MYDAIVVGARCAGASTAMLLARKGHRVLLVDRARFPSDTVSTHHLHQGGAAAFDRWGLLGRLEATGCRPVERIRITIGDTVLAGKGPPVGGVADTYVPRRTVLDHMLVQAAAEAGAEVREGFAVTGLEWDGDRVAGIRGRADGGAEVAERARIVVGADGQNSRVARAVGAESYKSVGTLTCGWYSYWSGVATGEVEWYLLPHQLVLVFPTHDDLACVYVGWTRAEFDRVRADVAGSHAAAIAQHVPELAERMAEGKREERFRGTGTMPNFYRRPWGEGWALVGDAAYNKDQTTGMGMSDAFIYAEVLAGAIDDGLTARAPMSDALAAYQRRRDEETREHYAWALEAATLRPVPDAVIAMYRAIQHDPGEIAKVIGAISGTVSSREVFSRSNIARILGSSREAEAAPAR